MFQFLKKKKFTENVNETPPFPDLQSLENIISTFINSDKRKLMEDGNTYYRGKQEILAKLRTAIGQDGQLAEIHNLPNNRVVDNEYARLVDQKVNYLLGKPFTLSSTDKDYVEKLSTVFNKSFHKMVKSACEKVLNNGICYIHPFIGDGLQFKLFPTAELIPIWADASHTTLLGGIHIYTKECKDGKTLNTEQYADLMLENGVQSFSYQNSKLIPLGKPIPYLTVNGVGYNWGKLPLLPFKYNEQEIPLISRVKSLQDALNNMMSDYLNQMEEDNRNTILVITNFEGEDLGEFRRNLSTYGAVKVSDVEGSRGGVSTLKMDVNKDNYESIVALLKKAIIDNGRGFDSNNAKLGTSPNQLSILSMYQGIDLDANGIEIEFQETLEKLLYFVNLYLDVPNTPLAIIFNRDMLINESEAISNSINSLAILSEETALAKHPWVSDVALEQKRKNAERDF